MVRAILFFPRPKVCFLCNMVVWLLSGRLLGPPAHVHLSISESCSEDPQWTSASGEGPLWKGRRIENTALPVPFWGIR